MRTPDHTPSDPAMPQDKHGPESDATAETGVETGPGTAAATSVEKEPAEMTSAPLHGPNGTDKETDTDHAAGSTDAKGTADAKVMESADSRLNPDNAKNPDDASGKADAKNTAGPDDATGKDNPARPDDPEADDDPDNNPDNDPDNDPDEETQDELYEHFSVTADRGQSPIRLDKFLAVRIEHCSRNRIQAAADAGNIRVNGKAAKSSYKVKPADRIAVVMPYPRRETELVPENIPLTIPYEDDDLLIVDKAAGMVVHPGHGNYAGTLVNALAYHLRQLPMFREGDMRAGLVHRIDKDTSGLLVVAKNERAHAHLARQFFAHTIQRRYVALVWGNLPDEGTVTGNIGRSPHDRLRMQVFADGEQGKHAVTHYRVLRRFGYVTLVECRLETGRTHQIRVHMEWIGHPLFGDARYGGDRILKGTTFAKYRQFVENCFALMPRQALHARSLGFVHPQTRQQVLFESPLPADFRAVLDKWEAYAAGGSPENPGAQP